MASKKIRTAGNRTSISKIQRMLELYQEGVPNQEIAGILGVSARTVQRWARRAGIHRTRAMSDAEILAREGLGPEILAGYERGETLEELSSRFKICRERLRKLLVKGGVQIRTPWEAKRLLSKEQVVELKELYPRLSVEQLGLYFNVGRAVISATLKRGGAHVLPRGGHVHRRVLYPKG
jgi:transposase